MTLLANVPARGVRGAWLWKHRNAFRQDRPQAGRRLLVDVSSIIQGDARTGIQRVVRSIWSQLALAGDQAFELLPVAATVSRGYCYAPADFLEAGASRHGVPVCAGAGDVFLGLDLSSHLLPRYLPQLRAWRGAGASVNLVVYDLLPLLRPEWFTPAASRNFRRWFSVVRRDCDQAICISKAVADDLRKQLSGAARPAVTSLGMGADIAGSVPSTGVSAEVAEVSERMRVRPAILMVGTIEPRKGHEAVLRAFEHLWLTRAESAPDLVIVGKGGWKTAALQQRIREHPELNRRLHWLDQVSDEGLCRLYAACRGLLMASYAEGFGLPLLEAASHGRPVLARDLPVFREQDLPQASYFTSDAPDLLGQSIVQLARSRASGEFAAPLPTWAEAVDELCSLLRLERGVIASPASGRPRPICDREPQSVRSVGNLKA